MKKNGKRYRRIQKEKELKRIADSEQRIHICQEVDDINIASLSMAHIVIHNPIVRDTAENKTEYLRRLKRYIKAGGWNRRKFENAQLAAYEKIILDSDESENVHDISYYKYFILFDVMHILSYKFKPKDAEKVKKVKETYNSDFGSQADSGIVDYIFWTFAYKRKKLKTLLNDPNLTEEKEYIELIEKNILFKKQEPCGVMVTATMSAGKSTFINALTGKYLCLSQNMACTSKIHSIVNKAFEDGFSSEYDYELALTAGKEELLNDNERNTSDKIVVSTNFNGGLSEERIIVNDSPGVNYSGNEEHKQITNKLIKRKDYNLLIYIMNATQLATNDESEHLDFVKRTIGRRPVLFIINKIDEFSVEEENVEAVIQRQAEMLREKGFKNPVVCPISARAGYLAKKYANEKLSRVEERELYNYVDKFEEMNLKRYYDKMFHRINVRDAENEVEQLLKTSGLAYVEKIITAMMKGEDIATQEPQSVCPVNVIAATNSGKSTLINALLGKKLMPSKYEACTATITEILDNDREVFEAVVYDQEDVVLREVSDLTYDVMNELNDNPEVHRISAKGNIPFLDAKSTALMLVDTPGFNNSQNQAHKNTTYRSINNDSNNLILYVLNGALLSTNDDADLLSYVAKQIQKGGKQVRDRFLFVINKMDGFNPEEEDIIKVIKAAKAYLASYGIEDPQIFPCSAFTALNIKTYFQNVDINNLTRSEERRFPQAARDTLPMIDKFIEYETMHLEKYSTLSPDAQKKLEDKLEQAEKNEDTKEQALIHSGIYSIEAAITAYAKEYAKARKVKNKTKTGI